MWQQLEIIGNLGADVELRYTPSGVPVASFNVATNKKWTDAASGQQQEKVTWFKVSCWRKQAEVVAEWLKKGSRVLVIGEVEAKAYTNKSGELVANLEVQAHTIKFLGGKGDTVTDGEEQPAYTPQRQAPATRRPAAMEESPFDDTSVPF